MAGRSRRIENVVVRYFRALERGDAVGWTDCFDDLGVVFDQIGSTPAIGPEALGRHCHELCAPFTRLHVEVDEVYPSDEGAATRWTWRGTIEGRGVVEFSGVDVFEIDEDDRIRVVWRYWNPSALLDAEPDDTDRRLTSH